jgi:hypothetical protein
MTDHRPAAATLSAQFILASIIDIAKTATNDKIIVTKSTNDVVDCSRHHQQGLNCVDE